MVTVVEVPCFVVYDIENDRVRHRISEACLDFGLERFQKSAFWGNLASTRRRELCKRLKTLLGDTPGRILVQPIGQEYVEERFVCENQDEEKQTSASSPADPAAPKPTVLRFK